MNHLHGSNNDLLMIIMAYSISIDGHQGNGNNNNMMGIPMMTVIMIVSLVVGMITMLKKR